MVNLVHWLLPDAPDVLGMLSDQAVITVEGLVALEDWAGGDADAGDRVRVAEHAADRQKRRLAQALTTALTTPLEPEDIFELSRRLDEVLNAAKDTVREAELMGVAPDAAMQEMACGIRTGVQSLGGAFAAFGKRGETATVAADAATKQQRHVERVYRAAMNALLECDDLRTVTAQRELYRRLARASDLVLGVADRVWYATLKLR